MIRFSVVGAAHPHVFEMIEALRGAGANLASVCCPAEPDVGDYLASHYEVPLLESLDAVLNEPTTALVVGAGIPDTRAAAGIAVMDAGKDYLVAKPGLIDREQLAAVRRAVKQTSRRYVVFFSERLASPSTMRAVELARSGTIGSVVHVTVLAPHRLREDQRPDWFWEPDRAGSLIVDLGSHQFDLLLELSGDGAAQVHSANMSNVAHPHRAAFADLATMTASVGAVGAVLRLDWLSPEGLDTWGDGRLFILGTEGYIEVRRNADVAGRPGSDHVLWVDDSGTHREQCGPDQLDFAPRLMVDLVDRTQLAQPQERVWRVAELCFEAEDLARRSQ